MVNPIREIVVTVPNPTVKKEDSEFRVAGVTVYDDALCIYSGLSSPVTIPAGSLNGDHTIGDKPLTSLVGKKVKLTLTIEELTDETGIVGTSGE